MPEPAPARAPDIDLRLVRCFTAVAEYRHFGRAAEALHTTQPSLSRQIGRLERQLGARLLDRTPQGSRLTEAGEVFLPLAAELLRCADQAAARTRAAAAPHRIVIGYTSGRTGARPSTARWSRRSRTSTRSSPPARRRPSRRSTTPTAYAPT
ncbi:MAG TPA: LysR family transcriptional regulator [Actinocrinis sp.]|jgi:DNA-binding transcriptional LysR family regulator